MSDSFPARTIRKIRHIIVILISMAGYVPRHFISVKTLVMSGSLIFAIYLSSFQSDNLNLAISYFIIVEILYFGFINAVLQKNGLRHWFIRKGGNENRGFLTYETILGFLFFHNGACIGYISSTAG